MGDHCSKAANSQDKMANVNSGMTPAQAMQTYGRVLSDYEKREIYHYNPIFFVGDRARKIQAVDGASNNGGFDDNNSRYLAKKHDHILYRYEILSGLGKGAFGDVYKAYDHATEKMVALKMIRNEKRFHRQGKVEVKVLNMLRDQDTDYSHCCVHMLDYFVFRNHLCITFEMHHNDLYTELKSGGFVGFDTDYVQQITEDTLRCLELLHRNSIVHADLKPENMLMTSSNDRRVKVIDFGSSCFKHEKVHTYIQSRYYRSPEVMLGLGYGPAIDMWSLGCIMVELATGSPIFPAKNEQELMLLQTEVLGVPPEYILDRGSRSEEFFRRTGSGYTPMRSTDRKGRRRVPNGRTLEEACQKQDPLFVDFVRRCLTWDPSHRMTPAQALQHGYLSSINFYSDSTMKRCFSEDGLVAMISRKSNTFTATLPTIMSKNSGSDKSLLNDSGISSHESDTDSSPQQHHGMRQPLQLIA